MGEMKGSAKGIDLHRNAVEEDPFAELADIFESELGREAFRSSAPSGSQAGRLAGDWQSVQGRQQSDYATQPTHPHAPDDEFAAAFEDVLGAEMSASAHPAASSPADMSYQSWLSPRGSRSVSAAAPPAQGASSARTAADRHPGSAKGDIETAIRGLSAPANPRGTIFVETQSFAPERVVDNYQHQPAARELDDFDELIASELAVMHDHTQSRGPGGREHSHPSDRYGYGETLPVAYADHQFDGQDAYEDQVDEPLAPRPSFLSRNAKALAAGVMALALVGAAGFFALGNPGADAALTASGEPLLIKADAEPYKIVPENPGGRSIPNQNKAVYERVASPDSEGTPTQQALLTQSEEPIDLPAEEEPASYDDLPGVDLVDNEGLALKDEGRIETASVSESDTSPIPVLQPRKVRTMVVRPDGTIVQSEPEAAAPSLSAAAQSAPAAGQTIASGAPALIEASSSLPAQPVAGAGVPYSAALVEEASRPAPPSAPQPETPAAAPTSDPMEVAAIAPTASEPVRPASEAAAAAPPPAGSYFVQISSQPSEAAAQSSLQSLGSRFANLIEGRSLGIQSADIPGKGTYYRVRVATASKDEAATLCNRLKSAGGNCFVAR